MQAHQDYVYRQAARLEAALNRILELYVLWDEYGHAHDDILADIRKTARKALK